MEETVVSPRVPRTTAEYKAAIAEMLAEMARLNEQMRRDQARIERSRKEAATLRDETRALLAAMGANL
jgi:cytochrome c556